MRTVANYPIGAQFDRNAPFNQPDDNGKRHCNDCDCEIDLKEMPFVLRGKLAQKEEFYSCIEHIDDLEELRGAAQELREKVRELESALRYKESLLADIFGGLDDFMKKYGGEK